MPIKNTVKAILATKGLTMTQLVRMLNEKYGRSDTLANLSKKLNKDTLKFREAEEIAEVLNYDVNFVIRSQQKKSD